jgi:hypothetical protein
MPVILTRQATHAIEMSRPSLCWALTSTAARLCQTLGYHRSVALPDDSQLNIQLKKRMFWYTYILDKSLSLRLGHSSILQDFDITLGLPELPPDARLGMWELIYQHWILIGRFQGRIYEELYSAQALSASDLPRRAKSIISDMKGWYRDLMKVCGLVPARVFSDAKYVFFSLRLIPHEHTTQRTTKQPSRHARSCTTLF